MNLPRVPPEVVLQSKVRQENNRQVKKQVGKNAVRITRTVIRPPRLS